jgi:hypothetical protein
MRNLLSRYFYQLALTPKVFLTHRLEVIAWRTTGSNSPQR